MKRYETTIIFDPGLEEARVNEEVERVTQPITQAGGEIVEVQRWGKRKLAYMIRKRRDGMYVHLKHVSPPGVIADMDRRFRLNECVLRFLTVISPKERPSAVDELAKPDEGAAAATTAAPDPADATGSVTGVQAPPAEGGA